MVNSQCTVRRRKNGHVVVFTAQLSQMGWDAIENQLLQWFNDKSAIAKTDGELRFNATYAGRGASALADKVESFFIGYCLRMNNN